MKHDFVKDYIPSNGFPIHKERSAHDNDSGPSYHKVSLYKMVQSVSTVEASLSQKLGVLQIICELNAPSYDKRLT